MKKISIILASLLVLLLIVKLKDKKTGERSFRAYAVQVDTSKVSSIVITPKGDKVSFELVKDDGIWMVKYGGGEYQADENDIRDILSKIAKLKTESVVGTSEDKWSEYEVVDSVGTHVIVKNSGKVLSDFIIGKFSYSQPQNANPYGRQNVVMKTYIRRADDKNVYAVDGYVNISMNRAAKTFRDKRIIHSNTDKWKKLTFNYQADSSFTMQKQDDKWVIEGIYADSATVVKYFSSVKRLNGTEFADSISTSDLQNLFCGVKVETEDGEVIEISAFKTEDGKIVFESSQNENNIIEGDKAFDKLFVSKGKFLKG